MREFKSRRTIDRVVYSPVILFILLVVLGFSVRATLSVYEKEKLSRESLDRAQRDLDKLTLRENTLNQSIAYLSTEQGVETEIRKKFRAVKDGEAVAIILDDASGTATTSTASVNDGLWGWKGWFNSARFYFFGPW